MGAQGTASLDFGSYPGASDCKIVITGQTGILSGSLVEAWVLPASTADHTADEHIVEELAVIAGEIVAGVGFTIYGVHRPAVTGPGGAGTRLYGAFNVGWVWN